MTDKKGYYELKTPPGTYTLVIQALAHKAICKKIVVGVHNTITINFELRESILGLDQVMGAASRNRLNAGDLLRFLYRPFPRCHP